jgi:sugar phosphate isomerase/epimerase
MSQYGVLISNFNCPVRFSMSDQDYYDSFSGLEKTARIARSLGIKRCLSVLMPASNTLEYAENFKVTTKRLRQICEVLKEYELSLGLEFIGPRGMLSMFKHLFVNTIEGTLELCDAVGTGNIGLVLDAHHCYTSGVPGDGYLRYIRSEKDIIIAHLNDDAKDVPYTELGDSPRYMPGEEGSGGNDVQAFMQGLKKIGYTGPVILEPFSKKLAQISDRREITKAVYASMDLVWPK